MNCADIPFLQGKILRCWTKMGRLEGALILCSCCFSYYSPSSWEIHAGSKLHRPWQFIFVEETGENLYYYKKQLLQSPIYQQKRSKSTNKAATKRVRKHAEQTEVPFPLGSDSQTATDVLKEVVSLESFHNLLTQEEKGQLLSLLPTHEAYGYNNLNTVSDTLKNRNFDELYQCLRQDKNKTTTEPNLKNTVSNQTNQSIPSDSSTNIYMNLKPKRVRDYEFWQLQQESSDQLTRLKSKDQWFPVRTNKSIVRQDC